MIGRRLGQYKILEKLGEGVSAVYLAEDTELKRQVALKILPPRYSPSKKTTACTSSPWSWFAAVR